MVSNNKTYRYVDKSKPDFRVLHITEDSIYTITLTDVRIEVPKKENRKLIEELFNVGEIIQIEDTRKLNCMLAQLNKSQEEKRNKRWKVIGEIWKNQELRDKFLISNSRKLIYEKVQRELSISFDQARRLLTQFLKNGMIKNALIDKSGLVKRGKQKKGEKTGPTNYKNTKRINDEDIENIQEAYTKYVRGKGYSFQTALDLMNKEKYSYKVIENGKEKYKLINPDQEITLRQFRYWSEPIRNRKKENVAKYGEMKVHNDLSLSFGSHRSKIRGPGSVYQLDATYLGINLISEIDEESIVSHPLLYSCIDVFSGMLVGVIVAFESESLRTTKLCLLNLLEDKVDYCNRFGLHISESDWPSHHLPSTILADNGKMKVSNVYEINTNFNVDFSFTKAYSGRDKSLIERSHGSFKRFLSEFFPCYDDKGPKERGKRDPKLDACLTYSELMELLLEFVISFNRRPIRDYPVLEEMQKDKIALTPLSIWHWGIKNGLSELNELSHDEKELLENLLLPRANNGGRKLRRTGIQFNNAHYISYESEVIDLFYNNIGRTVPVRYDPYDCSYIWFDINGKTYQLELSEDDKQYRGLSQEEMKKLKSRKYDLQIDAEKQAQEDRMNLKARTIQKLNQAERSKRKTVRPKSESLKRIKENNKREAEYLRSKEMNPEEDLILKKDEKEITPLNQKELRKKVIERNRNRKNARRNKSQSSLPES